MGSVKSEGFGVQVHGCLIFFEIVDKFVDYVILMKYKEGKISNNPQEDVYYAFAAFFFTGILISLARSALSLREIKQLCCIGNYSKDKTNAAIHLWMSLAKVWFEAFPQAIIVKFGFEDCATTDDIKIWGQAFGFFSLLPIIVFIFHVVSYYCYQCCQKRHYDDGPNLLTGCAMFLTLISSVVGTGFAVISIIDFNKRCPPQL